MSKPAPLPASLFWLPALHDPHPALRWPLQGWEMALRSARRLRLLARLGETMLAAGLMDSLPAPVQRQLRAELRYSRWRCAAVKWTLQRVARVLEPTPYPLVLLKGAAYLGQDLPIGAGRLPSDADVLVPRAHVADAQQRLANAGWEEIELDAHDRRYYHEWSHEVPPMRHPVHAVELDLHHNILPPTARTRIDAGLLFARLQPCGWPGWQVLQPADQVLHSAAHLFHDSDVRDRVRDIVDLDGLLRHFGQTAGFWEALHQRACELGLSEPLALAIHFATGWLASPVPDAVQHEMRRAGPGPLRRAWLHPLLAAMLTPAEPDAEAPMTQTVSAQIFLVRYHLGRMPLRLLVPHLWHKLRITDAPIGNGDGSVRGH